MFYEMKWPFYILYDVIRAVSQSEQNLLVAFVERVIIIYSSVPALACCNVVVFSYFDWRSNVEFSLDNKTDETFCSVATGFFGVTKTQ